MTDDIITRIKKQANAGYIDEHEVMLHEASDEIEQLRKLGNNLANGIRSGRWDNALDEWDKHFS